MNILIFSDVHNHLKIPKMSPDLILLLGDIDWRNVKKIDQEFSCPKLGVLGNHDREDTFVRTSVVNLHKNIVKIGDYSFAGFGGCPRYNNRDFGQYDEREVESFTDKLEKVDFFIAHSNPQWKIDYDRTNPHRGFLAFREYIDKKQPNYFLHGHIHENTTKKVKNTNIISVYPTLEIKL